jgi:hypothetical protein
LVDLIEYKIIKRKRDYNLNNNILYVFEEIKKKENRINNRSTNNYNATIEEIEKIYNDEETKGLYNDTKNQYKNYEEFLINYIEESMLYD